MDWQVLEVEVAKAGLLEGLGKEPQTAQPNSTYRRHPRLVSGTQPDSMQGDLVISWGCVVGYVGGCEWNQGLEMMVMSPAYGMHVTIM